MLLFLALFVSLADHCNALSPADGFKNACLMLEPQLLYPDSTLNVLQYVPAGTVLSFPDNAVSCNRPSQAVEVDICRIAMSLPTSDRSSVNFEAWLPRNWAGRFVATGNGGIDGCTKYEDIAYTSKFGFASVGSNNGHNGTTGVDFYQNPDVLQDYANRSLHSITVFGKRLVAKFYQRSHSKSYYIGCSLGGRQGMQASEKFPEDFDGIIAGSPALDFNNLVSWRASFFPVVGSFGSFNFIPATSWKGFIHDEVLRQCDEIDGVRDGIIEDPTKCKFDPSTLLCKIPLLNIGCLNRAQVEIVRKVFEPMKDEQGRLLYPGMQPGSEIRASEGLYSGFPWPPSLDWFKYVVYDPSWQPKSYNINDALQAEALNPFDIRTFPSDLEPFHQRGGKIITYHGLQDQQITSFNSLRFFEHLSNGTDGDLDSFYRFFRVPGMNHCNTGPGAWVLGQGGGAASKGITFDPKTNVLAAIVAWVEEGIAPETMTGTKFNNDDPLQGVAFQRRHCKYPLQNTFLGGDDHNIDAWKCLPSS